MKSYKDLYQKITSFDNIVLAAKNARRNKRWKENVLAFEFDLEKNLLQLQKELEEQTYSPGQYKQFYVDEGKRRLISAAPYRDRVVHHALMNVIEPILGKSFIHDSYANQDGKGTHRGMLRFRKFLLANKYVLKCDIKKYFPSIDHEILFQMIAQKIRCTRTLWLIRAIIDNSPPQEKVRDYFDGDDLFTPIVRRKGIPIGNLTSQFFANVYLNGLDHFVKEELRVHYYLRYVDDFAAFSNDKEFLWEVKQKMHAYLESQLRLMLHPIKTRIYQTKEGIDFLGFRVCRDRIRIRNSSLKRFAKRWKVMKRQMVREVIEPKEAIPSVMAWLGHAQWAQAKMLRASLFADPIGS